jgi:DNA-binding CsgD family transcriptional regulator
VLNGEAAVPRTLVARVIAEYRGLERRRIRPLGRREVLSEREREILRLMGEGRTTAQIAAECGIAPVTVRRHIASLLHKLKVPDRKSAIALVQERGV